MLLALFQQCLIFIALYYQYSSELIEEQEISEGTYCFAKHEEDIQYNRTALSVVDKSMWFIPAEYLSGVIIDNRFRVGNILGDGYTGVVRNGTDLHTGERVAIKFSPKDTHYSLEKEFINYLYLGADDPDVVNHGIPHIIHFGEFAGYKVLVMTLVGPTLHDLTKEAEDERFEMSTICKIGMQAVRVFQYIHEKGLIFHDVKPTNIAVDYERGYKIVAFDFAFSSFYRNALGESKPREETDEAHGTPEYMARGPLNRLTQVRKDDFISFGLVLLELNGVNLPWKDKTNDDDDIFDTMDIVLEEWDKVPIEETCRDSDNPGFFMEYFNYFDSLESHERPDYDYLESLFSSQLSAEDLNNQTLGIKLITT